MSKVDLICVDNNGFEGFLTLYKWYEGELLHSYLPTLNIDNYFYSNLSNDRGGNKDAYQIKVFMTREQWRDKKLNDLLNE
jgi:hypothetical protein